MNSKLLNRVLSSLGTAETTLQKVISETVAEGEYGVARLTSEAAEAIRKIRLQLDYKSESVADGPEASLSAATPANGHPKRVSANNRTVPQPKPVEAVSRVSKRDIYPRFEVRQDTLYRYGWSKRQKQEYVHKVPREIFQRTVGVIEQLHGNGPGPHMADEILKPMENGDEPAPSYQVYVVLGLLREGGCIEQVGREGYKIPSDVSEKAEKTWTELSAKANK